MSWLRICLDAVAIAVASAVEADRQQREMARAMKTALHLPTMAEDGPMVEIRKHMSIASYVRRETGKFIVCCVYTDPRTGQSWPLDQEFDLDSIGAVNLFGRIVDACVEIAVQQFERSAAIKAQHALLDLAETGGVG